MKLQRERACSINDGTSSFLYSSYLPSLLLKPLHISCNLLVNDLGIDLRGGGNGGMSHHLGNILYRNTCLQSQRAETVASGHGSSVECEHHTPSLLL